MGRRAAIIWGLVLVAIGLAFLADSLSGGQFDAGHFLSHWWPLLLILIGGAILLEAALPRGRSETRELALDLGGAASAEVRIDFGAGRLAVGPATPGRLLEGSFDGGVRYQRDAADRVRLWVDPADAWWGAGWRGFVWRVGLTRDVPLHLWVQCGASDNDLDLSELRLASLYLKTGASETVVRLPRAAGTSLVRVESGAATVRLEVPGGVAARISASMGLGSTSIDPRRFPPFAGGWASPDFASATNRIDITYHGGVGTLSIS